MIKTLKIVIPTAGFATRMRPQTWSKPKPLVSVAGKAVMDHLLDTFKSTPAGAKVEYVIIVGPGLGEQQIPEYMKQNHAGSKAHYVLQSVMKGQSDAIHLAREFLTGPMLMCFSDTLIETDFSFLAEEQTDVVAWVKTVPDPRRFGVAEVNGDGWVTHLTEKPESMENKNVVIGCYYFQSSEALLSAIEEQFRRKLERKGEYFLTDAINIMIERGAKVRTNEVEVWLDTGTIEATLETNRYMLDHGRNNNQDIRCTGVTLVPPVFIDPKAEVSDSVIGPYASIGSGCRINNARIEDSILEAGATVDAAALKGSFIGRNARVEGRSAGEPPLKLNIGDNSSVTQK
jgi:glucose-1-phosphate thymidylyltransferase